MLFVKKCKSECTVAPQTSAMLPLGGFSVHEGLNADFFVLAVEEFGKGDGFDFHAVGQTLVKGGSDGRFANSKGMRRL